MEKEIVFKPKTMQDIKKDRDFIHDYSYHNSDDAMNNVFVQRNWPMFLRVLEIVQTETKQEYVYDNSEALSEDEDLAYYQKYTLNGYSLIGIATIALQTYPFSRAPSKKDVIFKEKKEFIPKLFAFGLNITEKDKYFALNTKYEEFGAIIIKKMLLLPDILLLSETDVPQEAIRDIPLLMFELEESLL
jgi:hypothetical protein